MRRERINWELASRQSTTSATAWQEVYIVSCVYYERPTSQLLHCQFHRVFLTPCGAYIAQVWKTFLPRLPHGHHHRPTPHYLLSFGLAATIRPLARRNSLHNGSLPGYPVSMRVARAACTGRCVRRAPPVLNSATEGPLGMKRE